LAVLGLACAPPCFGGATYTSRAAFQAALTGFAIEEFENAPLVGTVDSGAAALLNFNNFSVATVPAAGKVLNVPAFGAVNSTPAGSRYLYLDTDIGLSGLSATFNFSQQLASFGFDYSGNFEPGNVLRVTVDGQQFNIPGSQAGQPKFWGYIDDPGQKFAAASVVTQTIQSALGVDRVTYGGQQVPEPQTLLLLASVLVLVRCLSRGR
jgi:hypothetical protein